MDIRLAETDDQIARCYPVMSELRPHIAETDFLPQVRRSGPAAAIRPSGTPPYAPGRPKRQPAAPRNRLQDGVDFTKMAAQ